MVRKISKERLHDIIQESINQLLTEDDVTPYGELSFEQPQNLRIEFVDRSKILPISDMLWDILQMSYAEIGGLKTYTNKRDFLKKARFAKLVYDGEEIVACAIYRRIENSYKMVAIGCNQEENGKAGVQLIVQDDIAKLEFHFWAEVSGAIEHYFKKYNGYPMPNTIAAKILGVEEDAIRPSTRDNAHYERFIMDDWFEKMIFGIKSEEIYNEAVNAVVDYSKFMRSINKLTEDTTYGHKYNVKQAIYIIENIYREHEENGFNELIPLWYNALQESLSTLRDAPKTETIGDYIEYGEYLLSVMPLLELHPLTL